MPGLSHQITPIETYMPPEDGRSITQSFILDGKNFMFDSKGPKSWFGHCPLTPFEMTKTNAVHSLTIQGRRFIFTADAILTWRKSSPYGWELLYGFSSELPAGFDPWSGFYLDDKLYLFHPSRGAFAASYDGTSDALYIEPQTDTTIPGLQANIRNSAIVRGRAILVNETSVQWSNTGEIDDLTPALGGAGFKEIAEYVQGTYLGLTSFQDGFVVWTTGGPLAAEYIGGDLVWNWYPLRIRNRPVNDHVMVELKDGTFAFLDSFGLKLTAGNGDTKDFPTGFNEFLKNYIQLENGQFTNRQFWRLDYDDRRDMFYLSESADSLTYWRTFVYAPSLEKWGIMNHTHLGFAQWTEDTFGFLATTGVPMYFTENAYSFTEPDNERGLDRYMPRIQKTQRFPSTTAIARSYVPVPELPIPPFNPLRPGWFLPGGNEPQAYTLRGMDSWIEIGYVRSSEMQGMVSDVFEFQQMFVSNLPSVPNFPVDFRTRHKKDLFYTQVEDWNSDLIWSPEDETEDYNAGDDSTEDLLAESGDAEDWNELGSESAVSDPDSTEDWNDDGTAEDWNSIASGLTPKPYVLQWLASMDGITFDTVKPRMARFDLAGQTFTGVSSGAYHRIRVEADEPMGFYHIAAAKVEIHYGGKMI